MQILISKERQEPGLLYLLLLLVFCFEPKLFVKYTTLNYLFVLGAVISFSVVLLRYANSRQHISHLFIGLLVYRLCFGIQTIVSNGDILTWGYMSIVILTLCLIFDLYMPHCPERLITALTYILLVYILVNVMITVVAPHGLVDGIYFIGIRTRTTEVVFVQMALTLVLDYMRGVKLSFRSIISISAGIVNLLISWVATAFAGLFVAILIFWIMKHSKKISKTLTVLFWTGISLLATLLVVVLRLQNLFAWFIEGVLNKNLTLTERTVIWDGALELIKEKPLFGYGMQTGGNIVPFAGSLWQTHNQWLQLLVDGGAITLISFVVVLLIVSISSNKYATSKSYLITISVFAAFTIMSTAEIYSYMPYFFILLFMIHHLSDIEEISDSEDTPVQLQGGKQ